MRRKPGPSLPQRPSRSCSRSCCRCARTRCRRCSGSGRASRSRAPGRCPAARSRRRHARRVDPPPPRREGGRPRARPRRAARHVERPRPEPEPLGARHRLSRPRPRRRRSRSCPTTPPGTRSTSCRRSPSTTARSCSPARERLRAKLSYTNVGFALAPPTFTLPELRDLYVAALGHEVSATNLKRVLLRRDVLEPTGARRDPGRAGGRPAELYRFRSRRLEITDPFAALRPPS